MATSNSTFALMMRKHLVDNKKTFIYAPLATLAVTFLIGMWVGYIDKGGGSGLFAGYLFTYIFLTPIIASFSFSDMKKKEGRINLLMTPATTLEKILPRIIYVFGGWAILGIIGYYSLECGRMLSELIFRGEPSSIYHPISLINTEPAAGWAIAFMIGVWFVTMSYFFMGAILWPRYSYLISVGVIWVIQLVGTLIIMALPSPDLTFTIAPLKATQILETFIVMLYVIGIIMLWMSYLRLKHSKVTYGIFK